MFAARVIGQTPAKLALAMVAACYKLQRLVYFIKDAIKAL